MSERRPLGRNMVANAVTAASVLLTALISVPLMLDEIGLAGYGVWTLVQTLILWTTIAEAGFGPAIQRFVAVGHGAGAGADVRRLLWSTCLAYAAVGAVLAAVCAGLGPFLVDLFDVPSRLREDAVTTFRIAGGVVWLALLAAGLGNVQQGLERFGAIAVSAAIGSVVFLAAVVALLAAGHGLPGIAVAAALQQAVMLVVRAVDLRRLFGLPGLLGRGEAVALGKFSLRLQVTSLSVIINSQTDKVVVGLVSSTATLGQLGIGTQVAEAGRLLAGAALSPIISRLSVTHGERDTQGMRDLFESLHKRWTLLVIGGTVIGVLALYPLITGWLGDGHDEAVAFGAALIIAYGTGLLTGIPVAYLRALGRPSLEARLGATLVVWNVLLTVALGFAFGAYGVVVATAVAHVIATTWFLRSFRRVAGPELGRLPLRDVARGLGAAVVAGCAALAWGLAMLALLPSGPALAAVAAGTAAAAGAYLAFVMDVRPTPTGIRRLLAG